ncbi:MAG: metallophosphoesterase [Bacilli bacterium]|nr:metallophosphoesterase [Bacilli bacterium]
MSKIIKFIFFLIILTGGIYLYGTKIEIKNIKVHEYNIKSEKITENFNGFKIVHVTDIHYGRVFNKQDLKKLINKINNFEPDIVVFTGDLIDKDTKMTTTKATKISEELNKISATNGKYIISGNNDLKFDEWENIITNGGFINLNNNYDTIYNNGYDFLLLGGVSSLKDKESIINKNQKTENFLNSFEKNGPIYKILLMHEPDYIDQLKNNPYDLVLAGHAMGGTVKIPFIGPVYTKEGAKKYVDGHYKINNTDLYVSNGIGLSKYNFRFLNTPSFNIYRLIQK